MTGEELLKIIDPGTGLTQEELIWAFMSPKNARAEIRRLKFIQDFEAYVKAEKEREK